MKGPTESPYKQELYSHGYSDKPLTNQLIHYTITITDNYDPSR